MRVGPLHVSFGGSLTLSTDLVRVSDVDTPLDELILTVEQRPRHGNLTNNRRPMTVGDQFTVDQLGRHDIRSAIRYDTLNTVRR